MDILNNADILNRGHMLDNDTLSNGLGGWWLIVRHWVEPYTGADWTSLLFLCKEKVKFRFFHHGYLAVWWNAIFYFQVLLYKWTVPQRQLKP